MFSRTRLKQRWVCWPVLPIVCLCLLSVTAFAEHQVIGTIEAVLNGEKKVWHILQAEDALPHGAWWMTWDGSVHMASIGGFESKDVKFDKDESGFPTVDGDGSSLAITFKFDDGGSAVSYSLPSMGAEPASVIFMSTTGGGISSMYGLEEGQITANRIEVVKSGLSGFSGTFSGKLQSMSGKSMEITDGRFEVSEAGFIDSQ